VPNWVESTAPCINNLSDLFTHWWFCQFHLMLDWIIYRYISINLTQAWIAMNTEALLNPFYTFLTLVLDKDMYSTSCWNRYPLDRKLGGPQSFSGLGGEEKISCLCQEFNSDFLISSPYSSVYTNRAILSHNDNLTNNITKSSFLRNVIFW
jgi:hypothetical protein